MKKLTYLTVLLFILIISSCNKPKNQSKITLHTNGFSDSTKIYLKNTNTDVADSGYIMDNKLIFSVDIQEPTRFVIKPVIKSREDIDYRFFWKENEQVTIWANGKLMDAKVESGEIQVQEDFVEVKKNELRQIDDSLLIEYKAIAKEDTEKRKAIRDKHNEIAQAIKDVDINYIKNNPTQLYSAFILKNLMKYSIPKDKTKELYKNLSSEIQLSDFGILVKKFIDLNTDFKIGDKAKNFELPDLNGKMISLDSFKGKYILLDFWSSNCGPCRMENPNLLKSYKAYKDKGFEILGVCLDKNKEDWANTVREDSMIWTTVSDLKGFDGDVAITYNVYFIPTYYLIDREGIIIDKILGRGKLEEKLKSIAW